MFEAVSELLGLSEKLQVFVSGPTFFPLCLALTGEGTGGLTPLNLLAVCSSAHGWLWVNLWTCAGAKDRKHYTSYTIRDGDQLTLQNQVP